MGVDDNLFKVAIQILKKAMILQVLGICWVMQWMKINNNLLEVKQMLCCIFLFEYPNYLRFFFFNLLYI